MSNVRATLSVAGEREIEETRERLAHTIDQLLYRAKPEDDRSAGRSREVKGFFVDPRTGEPRTENILKVVGGVVGADGRGRGAPAKVTR